MSTFLMKHMDNIQVIKFIYAIVLYKSKQNFFQFVFFQEDNTCHKNYTKHNDRLESRELLLTICPHLHLFHRRHLQKTA